MTCDVAGCEGDETHRVTLPTEYFIVCEDCGEYLAEQWSESELAVL